MISSCGILAVVCDVGEGGMGGLLQYGDLASAVHNRQFIGKALFLPYCNHALLIFFLCSFHQFDCPPESNMSLVIISKYTVEES
jgi:hypothetical protein